MDLIITLEQYYSSVSTPLVCFDSCEFLFDSNPAFPALECFYYCQAASFKTHDLVFTLMIILFMVSVRSSGRFYTAGGFATHILIGESFLSLFYHYYHER